LLRGRQCSKEEGNGRDAKEGHAGIIWRTFSGCTTDEITNTRTSLSVVRGMVVISSFNASSAVEKI
jgi:hypothetical protein